MQIAYNTGYVKVDWKRVEKDLDKAKEQLSQGSVESVELNTFVKKVNIGETVEGYYMLLTEKKEG